MSARRSMRAVAGALAAAAAAELLLAPCADASTGGTVLPAGLFGIPSLHSIIQAIANGFLGALASALVPSWLKHGTIATIQHLVALPDPATWPHVARLQSDTTFLAAMLLPLTLAVGALRYWMIGLTGAAHPATALTRSVAVTGILVIYRWGIEQTVAGTNTLTHGILELPSVGDGLQRIIGVLFGGALLTGTGGVFGALLVIVGVMFAAGLFAAQVLVTVVLSVLIVAGPPLIAISAIPELSHLARSWADAVLAVALVPIGWTLLFATAGALCLDATSFTAGSGGLPGHVAAAFAGLITFVLAVRLPMMAAGQLRHLFEGHGGAGRASAGAPSRAPGADRVRAAHSRLRAVALDGVPSLGRSAGRAAGALGAPQGGPLGAGRRGLASVARRTGLATASSERAISERPGDSLGGRRGRLASARNILANAPREAAAAVAAASRAPRARPPRNVNRKATPGRPTGARTPSGSGRGDRSPAEANQSVTARKSTPRGARPAASRGAVRPPTAAEHAPPAQSRRKPTGHQTGTAQPASARAAQMRPADAASGVTPGQAASPRRAPPQSTPAVPAGPETRRPKPTTPSPPRPAARRRSPKRTPPERGSR